MAECIFCKIIQGDIPTQKVFESDRVLGFKDISPQAPIHYLFIPKEHFDSMAHVPSNKISIFADLFAAIQQTAQEEGIAEGGYRALTNIGRDGGQAVSHLHIHLIGGKQLGPKLAGGP